MKKSSASNKLVYGIVVSIYRDWSGCFSIRYSTVQFFGSYLKEVINQSGFLIPQHLTYSDCKTFGVLHDLL